jgi:hypothetical protein
MGVSGVVDIILVSHQRGRTWRVTLSTRRVMGWLPFALVGALAFSATLGLGYWIKSVDGRLPVEIVGLWAGELHQQRQQLTATRELVENNTSALARRLAQLHAHVMRLDAAGARLTEIAGLDKGEFNFGQPPAVGGPEIAGPTQPVAVDEVLSSLASFEKQLADRERQMRVLEDLLLASRLQKEVRPSGWPAAGRPFRPPRSHPRPGTRRRPRPVPQALWRVARPRQASRIRRARRACRVWWHASVRAMPPECHPARRLRHARHALPP